MRYSDLPDAGDLYDGGYADYQEDFDFYLSEARAAQGAVLDVACGTGRLLLPMMERGIAVWGIDLSEPMLTRLREKAQAKGLTPKVYCADMCTFALDQQFALIFLAARSFLHNETTEEQLQTLRNLHHHLQDGGKLALNFFHPTIAALAKQDGSKRLVREFPHPHTGRTVKWWFAVTRCDLVHQWQEVENLFEELDADGRVLSQRYASYTLRWIYKAEFELLLRLAGFSRYEVYGGFDRRSLTRDFEEMVWVAWK